MKSQNSTLEYYQNNALSLINHYETANVKEIQQLLLQIFCPNTKLLEIGCGSGRDASFLIENGYNITAIDGSKNIINEAKKIHPELSNNLLYKVLPDELDFDQKFDGVYSIATLMHLPVDKLKNTILRIYKLLKMHGIFLISVSLHRDNINTTGFDEKGRFFLILTKNEWINIFKNSGFIIQTAKINKDGLNRDNFEWLTLVMKK